MAESFVDIKQGHHQVNPDDFTIDSVRHLLASAYGRGANKQLYVGVCIPSNLVYYLVKSQGKVISDTPDFLEAVVVYNAE